MSDRACTNSTTDDLDALRQSAVGVVRKLVDAGFIAYFAGGCVRDKLMGHPPTDYDVATDAHPEDVAKLFRNVQTVGESFGVMIVRAEGNMIQIATFRTDGEYSDRRHPDSVTFTDAEHDANRRDFTINGLFEDPLTEKVIDYVGGKADLEAGVIRGIGDPAARMREDHLRMLRAVRFAARFGFSIDAETADAIRKESGELAGVSRERIGHEVRRMMENANRAVAAWEMQYLGLDSPVLSEPMQLVAPTRLGRLPDDAPLATSLAAWILDRHEQAGDDLRTVARAWIRALMLSNLEAGALKQTLRIFETLRDSWQSLGVARQKRLASSEFFDQGLMLMQASDRQRFVDIRRQVTELAQNGLAPEPVLNGTDLIELGLVPGPLFSKVLRSVYDAQLEGSVTSREQGLDLARAIAAAESTPGQN